MSAPLLEVDGLHCSFRTPRGDVRAVEDVSFTIDAGQSLGVVGESGSGKTVTAMSIVRLFPPMARVRMAGRVRFEGVDLLQAPNATMHDVRGGQIGVIFQDPLTSLDPVMPVAAQIAESIRLHKRVPRAAATKRAIELMERVGIPDAGARSKDLPHRFSGGMRQRLMIAIAIACEPKLLIADEATTALDATVQAQILSLLGELQRELGMAMMVISHDLGVIAAVCDTAQVMYAGQIVERTTIGTLLEEPLHPYSRALLRLVPKLEHSRHHKLHPIPGSPPTLASLPAGCRFAPRCELRFDRCDTMPELVGVGAGSHHCRCWLMADGLRTPGWMGDLTTDESGQQELAEARRSDP